MSRADDCAEVNGPHLKHVPVCQRTGYANGRADALDEVEQAIAALVAEIDDDDSHRVQCMVEGLRATRKVRADG